MADAPYNPLDKTHLGKSVARALLVFAIGLLPPANPFIGAGIYALYYIGDFPAYQKIAEKNCDDQWAMPTYVGKAATSGTRKGD
jgi:hypothetical protein